MKPILVVLLVVASLAMVTCSKVNNDSIAQNKSTAAKPVAEVSKQATAANFSLSFNEGLEKASLEKKNMIVDFYTDWCHWCKVMDEKTFHDSTVANKLQQRFITVRINAESPTDTVNFQGHRFTNIELTQAFRVTGFPSLAFISPDKEVITVIPGYIPAEPFNYLLDYIDQECYKKQMSFEEFMKRKGDCNSDSAAPKSTTKS
ncbi:MAG: thioredoxin family protein [candidate division KSB1 bacterium]|nr:thioredoxin family protein [candidate division KSB1 bacterium]MDZ7319068.1 thioredoxin family protein [candidate division KSB1 bacterium]MDZ7340535.1 thioredoxin family protein [candidate division KSB1 bacterium]